MPAFPLAGGPPKRHPIVFGQRPLHRFPKNSPSVFRMQSLSMNDENLCQARVVALRNEGAQRRQGRFLVQTMEI